MESYTFFRSGGTYHIDLYTMYGVSEKLYMGTWT